MKKTNILVLAVSMVIFSCGNSSEAQKEENKVEDTESTEEVTIEEEDQPFTTENLIGTWAVIEFDSELDGAADMNGKTFVFTSDSLSFSFIDNQGLVSKTCVYEIYDEATIKVTVPIERGSMTKKYTGFIEGNILRLNDQQGSLQLEK